MLVNSLHLRMKRRNLLSIGTATIGIISAGCTEVIGPPGSTPSNPTVGSIALFNDTLESKSVSVLVLRDGDVEHWEEYTIPGESPSSENTTETPVHGNSDDTLVIASPLSRKPGEYLIGARLRETSEFETMHLSGDLHTVGTDDCQRVHIVIEPDGIGLAKSRLEQCKPIDSAQ